MGRAEDITGKRFGRLVVEGRAGSSKDGSRMWRCTCDCGREATATTRELTSGRKSRCAPWDHDILGARFGRLIVMDYRKSDARGQARMLCRCDCGDECVVCARDLKSGNTRSCGCMEREQRRANMDSYRLRVATGDGTRLDALTRKTRSDNTSGVKGVYYDKMKRKWIARITLRGRRTVVGRFDSLAEAAEARREAEQDLFDPVLEDHGMEPTDEDAYEKALGLAVEKRLKRKKPAPPKERGQSPKG